MKKKLTVLIPIGIQQMIEKSEETKLQKSRAYRIVDLILNNDRREEWMGLDEYLPIPKNYWVKTIGDNYHIPLGILKDLGIVQSNESYSTDLNQCKEYCIKASLLDSEFEAISIEASKREAPTDYVSKMSLKTLKRCKMDKVAAKHSINDYVKGDAIENKLLCNDEIEEKPICLNHQGQKYYTTTSQALETARVYNSTLIQDDIKFIIENKENYLQKKRQRISYHFRNTLEAFSSGFFYAKRNHTNNRLDTNLTSMPGILITHLTLNREKLVSIDLSNSQFVILSALIPQWAKPKPSYHSYRPIIYQSIDTSSQDTTHHSTSTSALSSNSYPYMCVENGGFTYVGGAVTPSLSRDLVDFQKFSKNGNLYEYIRDELCLGEGKTGRKRAKILMFEIFFSSHKYHSTNKKKVKTLFPTLCTLIDEYKKAHGDNQFAIILQKTESKIFIDGILTQLYQKGFDVLSKHDSILCKESDTEAVEAVVREVLDKELGEYQLKIE